MSIKEEVGTRRFGICFADTATGEVNVCSIEDDECFRFVRLLNRVIQHTRVFSDCPQT